MNLTAPTGPIAGLTAHHETPNTSAMAQAMRLYSAANEHIEVDLGAYLRHGSVIVRPELVLLYRPISRRRPDDWLADHGEADAWYVRLLVGRGTLRAALAEMPYVLPWCCWHRDFRNPGSPLHCARTDQLIKKLRK